jgi:hypothetical protein
MSYPPGDYPIAEITLDPCRTRDIIHLLIDVHSAFDHLYLDGTQPQITAPAEDYLRESGSDYTLPAMIDALGGLINQLTWAARDAVLHIDPSRSDPGRARPVLTRTSRQHTARWRPRSGVNERTGAGSLQDRQVIEGRTHAHRG